MSRFPLISVLLYVVFFGVRADMITTDVESALDSFSRMDIIPADSECMSTIELCGPIITTKFAGNTNLFVSQVQEYCTNLCSGCEISSGVERARAKTCLEILREHGGLLSRLSFAFCATNCTDIDICDIAAYNYAEMVGPVDELVNFFRSDDVQALPLDRLNAISESVLFAFEANGGTSLETNRMISIALEIVAGNRHSWNTADHMVSKWWPDYVTSSNRYLAAVSARNAIPTPTSTNYLNRVISELEALPPGTMQMLSTNHLGAAWNEN